MAETWVINEHPDTSVALDIELEACFGITTLTSGNIDSFYNIDINNGIINYGGVEVYQDGSWYDEQYKTIEATNVLVPRQKDGDTWLKENAYCASREYWQMKDIIEDEFPEDGEYSINAFYYDINGKACVIDTLEVVDEELRFINDGSTLIRFVLNGQTWYLNDEPISAPELPLVSPAQGDLLTVMQMIGTLRITNLTGYTWVGNDILNDSDIEITMSINFISNNTNYVTFERIKRTSGFIVDDLLYNYDFAYQSPPGSWLNDNYKTIEITGGSDVANTTLIAWLEANGTLTAPQPTHITLDLSTIGLPVGSHTIQMKLSDDGLTKADSELSNSVTYVEPEPTPDLPVHASLQEYSWAEIKQLADALVDGTLSVATLNSTHHIAVGDTKTATINGESHSYRVVDFLHDVDASGNQLGFTFEQTDLMTNTYVMKSSMSEDDNWANSDLINTINNFTIESSLNAVITPAKKVCCNSVSQSGTYNQTNKLWIMSETEIANSQDYTYGQTVEGSPYLWYTNSGYSSTGRIKNRSGSADYYWLRSPQNTSPKPFGVLSYFANVSYYGNMDYSYADFTYGVAPCFCI